MTDATELCTSVVAHCRDVLAAFGRKEGARLPIVCNVRNGSFPYVMVPSGVFAIKSSRGRQQETPLAAGLHFMWPWERIQYIITPQYTFFDTPVKDCPTADNVMVKIDVFMVFRIVNPREFVVKLSPEKLGDLLKAAQEEAVRNIARNTPHTKIYDLTRYDEKEIVAEMNSRFQQYGVEIVNMMITDVKLPDGIAVTLENETTYQSRERLQKRTQGFEVAVQRDEASLKESQLKFQNERLAFVEESKKRRALIQKEISELEAHTQKLVAEIQAAQDATVRKKTEEANLIVSKLDAKKKATLLEFEATAAAERDQILSEQVAYTEEKRAATALIKATHQSKALQLQAEAEGKAAQKLAAKRQYDLAKKEVDILRGLAANNQVILSGKTNGDIVAQVAVANMQKGLYKPAQ